MAVKVGDKLEKVSLVLTTDQVRRLKALAQLRATDWRRVSMSDVSREVVEAGLGVVSFVPVSSLVASEEGAEEKVS